MCTAISFKGCNHYFGRTLDLEYRFNESVIITPRNYIIRYKSGEIDRKHYALIGIGSIIDDYPLYYDATNEVGLSIAALNFVGYAHYGEAISGKINVTPYELIIYILSRCSCVKDAISELKNINFTDIPFNTTLQNSQLHWLISDKYESITLESTREGIKIYENYLGALTNNPPFNYHLMHLNNFINISSCDYETEFSKDVNLLRYSKGMNAIGLPGDNSSMSRFVRVVFNKFNSLIPNDNIACVSQFFHILSSVEQVDGSVVTNGKRNRTQYMSCCDTDSSLYYYKTYNNNQITCVNMHKEDIENDKIISYSIDDVEKINYINK